MSSGNGSGVGTDPTTYGFLKDTYEVALDLTERLILLGDPGMAANANVIRSQLYGLVDGEINGRVADIPLDGGNG